ncbi:MAG: pilin [Patescibacteria group bacterium]|jgi:hypothetical protein
MKLKFKKSKIFKLALVLCFAFQIGGMLLAVKPAEAQETETQREEKPSIFKKTDPTPINFYPQVGIPDSDFKAETYIKSGSYSDATGETTSTLLARYVKAIYNYGIAVVGILAAVVLMAGGILWLTSAGNDSKIAQAKELITGSIVGTGILLGAWLILNTINPDLVELKAIEVKMFEETSLESCCNYSLNGELTAKSPTSQKECEKLNGQFYEKGKILTSTTGILSTCVDTGCCRCLVKRGVMSSTQIKCSDEKNYNEKILPDTCESICKLFAGINETEKFTSEFYWGQKCDANQQCVFSTEHGAGGEY